MRKVILVLLCISLFSLPVFAQVDTAWVRRYNGPGNSTDRARALVVDASGNLYVTGYTMTAAAGYDYLTIKYSSGGDQLWARTYNGPANGNDLAYAIALDGSGNVYVAGGSGGDYGLVKYDPSGNELWDTTYNGPGNGNDEAYAIAVDLTWDFILVTGRSWGVETLYDYATIKYDSEGQALWEKRYDGPIHQGDVARGVAVDASGCVYVTGDIHGGITGFDYLTLKYHFLGVPLWEKAYNGPGNSADYALAIAVDGSGNIYVTGRSVGSGTNYDYATIKYYPNGDTAWVRRYDGPVHWWDEGLAIAVDGSGNVYVTGGSAQDTQYHPLTFDYATVKYDSTGSQAWAPRYDGPVSGDDLARSLAVDANGSVFVTGYSVGDGTDRDYTTIKYRADGTQIWEQRYNGPGNGKDEAYAIAADGCDTVYVTGYSYAAGKTGEDYLTIKYIPVSVCGDVNADGLVDIGDVVYLINYLYHGGPPPPDPWTADLNDCDGEIDIGDVVYLINYLYHGGPPPACCER